MTDVEDTDHLITDPAMALGMIARAGTYVAMCGRVILGASLSAAPRWSCSECVSWLPGGAVTIPGRPAIHRV